jgi:hypothetical protein
LIAYKFLCAGRVAPFTRHVWPEPGGWVTAGGSTDVCLNGVHACTPDDLPRWLDDELWEIELDGRIVTGEGKVAAERGRLVRRIHGWNAGTAGDFALACAMRARDHVLWALRQDGAAAREIAQPLSEAFNAGMILDAAQATDQTVRPESLTALGYAADAASTALDGESATTAYVAAHAAGVIRGDAASDAERAWQADWLSERLELTGR